LGVYWATVPQLEFLQVSGLAGGASSA